MKPEGTPVRSSIPRPEGRPFALPAVLALGLVATGCASSSSLRPSTASPDTSGLYQVPPGTEEITLDPEAFRRHPDQATGVLRLTIAWPEPARGVQAFPATTTSFRLTVTASDISQPIVTTINRTPGAATESVRLVVPVGTSRTLAVEGRNAASRVVASKAVSGLAVQAGQYTPVTVGLETQVGNVTGTVIDGDSGLGVSGVTVSLDGLTTTTDASGSYVLADVNAGSRTAAFSRSGYLAGSQAMSVTAGSTLAAGALTLPRQHWVAKISGTSQNLRCVATLSNTKAFVGGDGGTLLVTLDGGDIWTPVSLGTSSDVFAIQFVDASNGFLVTGNSLLGTTDGGSTWAIIKNIWGYGLVAFDASNVYWGAGNLYKTSNGGVTYTSVSIPGTIKRLAAVSSQILWHTDVYQSSTIYKSTSSGSSWSSIVGLPISATGGILAESANEALVAGYGTSNGLNLAQVIKTVDGGVSWTTEFSSAVSATSVEFLGLDRFGGGYCAVGSNGTIAIRPTGGTWAASPIIPTNRTDYDMNAVGFFGTTTGFAVGAGGRILKY